MIFVYVLFVYVLIVTVFIVLGCFMAWDTTCKKYMLVHYGDKIRVVKKQYILTYGHKRSVEDRYNVEVNLFGFWFEYDYHYSMSHANEIVEDFKKLREVIKTAPQEVIKEEKL